jgi:hypothetical protein
MRAKSKQQDDRDRHPKEIKKDRAHGDGLHPDIVWWIWKCAAAQSVPEVPEVIRPDGARPEKNPGP